MADSNPPPDSNVLVGFGRLIWWTADQSAAYEHTQRARRTRAT